MTFGLVKHNNNSISAITSAGQLAQGKMTLIKEQTASSSSSISFVDGSSSVVLDSTYPIYLFKFYNIHPSGTNRFQFNGSSDSGSNYNVTKTTTIFIAANREQDDDSTLTYQSGDDLAQSTAFQDLMAYGNQGADNDHNFNGTLHLFNPSDTTFVKHFISNVQNMIGNASSRQDFIAGYGNTTSAINAIDFKFASGNIDSGTIDMYGVL